MSDVLNSAVEALARKIGGGFDGSVKFEIDGEGAVRLDESGASIDDGDADCTISADYDTFKGLMDGELNPTTAFMTGKLRIAGDMSKAMALASALG